MEKRWYVVHTYSGYENKVKTNLEKRVESMEMQDKIFTVLVPMEEVVETKDGKKKSVQRKFFPGYVLVEMVMTDDSWYVVRNTPGVTGFVGSTGSGSKPIPLQAEEVNAILKQMGVEQMIPPLDVAVGDRVKVKAGPFADLVGNIDEVQADKLKVKVMVNMFGRETPVELDFSQIEKI
ncbi:transcription termination/antitermination protein NusG [Rubeoparvulum massiliense]|uniref:transcription termination/antitermination protein NusG n=1 Tax=Rubeoparvulum massiliense TaxID=1631346 RepID=UPI00065E9319|nr:transcription termination/antitermination protein NusG [Rubeoparvulum massiliense]